MLLKFHSAKLENTFDIHNPPVAHFRRQLKNILSIRMR